MAAFTPTLRLATTRQMFAQMVEQGFTLEDARTQVIDLFASRNLATPVTLMAATIYSIEDDIVLTDFEAIVIAKYKIDGDIYLKLATGDVVGMDFIIV